MDSIHPWYYWFDEQPRLQREDAVRLQKLRLKSTTHKMPAFSLTTGIGYDFFKWLQTSCGGGKSQKEATQQGRRAMKFLMYAVGEPSMDAILSDGFIDCCLGTPSIIINFLQSITETWELSYSGSLNYLRAMSDLMDFRKSLGVTDNVLRTFTVTEVYIRRGIGNLTRQKKINYNRNLDLEQLIARNSWASLEEMEKVIPYHAPKFQDIVKNIRCSSSATVYDIAFATRFIITFLFLRVKCTRPMSYKYLTLTQYDISKTNGGYIDQSTFKTQATYAFDTIILSEDAMAILDTYIKVIRPLTHPSCDFVLVTANGNQYTALGTAMSLLVFQAIGKVVNPSRYRQIVESESADKLNAEEREVISLDQRHSSSVAKRIYQKKLSRNVAADGRSCIQKLCGTGREEHNSSMVRYLTDTEDRCSTDEHLQTLDDVTVLPLCEHAIAMDANQDEVAVTPPETVILQDPETMTNEALPKEETMEGQEHSHCTESLNAAVVTSVKNSVTTSMTLPNTNLLTSTCSQTISSSSVAIENHNATSVMSDNSNDATVQMDLDIKKEEAQNQVSESVKLLRFTPEEDKFLKEGTKKYGLSNWSKILKDANFHFHACRTRDALRVRAETIGLTNRKRNVKQRKCKNVITI